MLAWQILLLKLFDINKVTEVNIRTFLWRKLARDEPESSGSQETSLLVHLTTPSRTLSQRRGACSFIKPSSTSPGRGRALKECLDDVRSRWEKELKGGNVHLLLVQVQITFALTNQPFILEQGWDNRYFVLGKWQFYSCSSLSARWKHGLWSLDKEVNNRVRILGTRHEKTSRTCLEKNSQNNLWTTTQFRENCQCMNHVYQSNI